MIVTMIMMMMVTRLHGIGVRKGEKLAKRKRNNGFVLCTVDNHSENGCLFIFDDAKH